MAKAQMYSILFGVVFSVIGWLGRYYQGRQQEKLRIMAWLGFLGGATMVLGTIWQLLAH